MASRQTGPEAPGQPTRQHGRRLEDARLLTVGGTYLADLPLPGAAHVAFVRANTAHARLLEIDLATARALPGVLDVRSAAEVDLPPVPPEPSMLNQAMPQPVLATDTVRYVGEPVAVVVAESPVAARRAAAAVRVRYEPLPVVVDPTEAGADEVLLHPAAGTNTAFKLTFARPAGRGDTLDGQEVVVRLQVDNQRLAPCPLEVRAGAARWEPDARLTYWGTTQGPHLWRPRLASALSLSEDQVRIVSPDVGGAFGAKGLPYPEDILVAWLARVLRRPLRWAESRRESMLNLGHGRAQRQVVELGGDRQGRIRAYRLHVVQDCGAYPRMGAFLPYATRTMLTGPYQIERAKFTSDSVVTNTTPVLTYRGAGQPEATTALERAVDRYAAEIGMDPAEVRLRNLIGPEDFPYRTLTRVTYDSGDYPQALTRLLAAADYPGLREQQRQRRARGEVHQLGVGLSVFVKVTNAETRPERAEVRVGADGRAEVRCGTFAHGQGHATTYATLAAGRLGIAEERIVLHQGDSDALASGGGTGGSRSLQTGGVAVTRAADELVNRACEVAAKLLDAPAASFDPTTAGFRATDEAAEQPDSSRQVGWPEVAEASGGTITAEAEYQATAGTFPYGAYLAVVEVDTETGRVQLLRMVTVDDAGRIINQALAEGQVHGGVAQGVAQALYEHMRYDADGQPVTDSLASYLCLSPAELPSLETHLISTPTDVNELGVKGIGESGSVGAPPAVQNAVVDALSHLGVRHIDTPLTPERVWRALADAADGAGAQAAEIASGTL